MKASSYNLAQQTAQYTRYFTKNRASIRAVHLSATQRTHRLGHQLDPLLKGLHSLNTELMTNTFLFNKGHL